VRREEGAGHVEDDVWGLVGGGLGGNGLSVFLLAIDHALAIEEELGDVGEGGGVAAGDAVVGEVFQEVGEEEVDGGGLGESVGAGEEVGGYGVDGEGALGAGGGAFGGG
jgi:hypothetical protein